MEQGQAPRVIDTHGGAAVFQQPLAEYQVAEHASFAGQPELGAIGELPGPTDVVDERGGQKKIGVQARMELADLLPERGHGHGVLEQSAQVGVVARSRARRAAPGGAHRPV